MLQNLEKLCSQVVAGRVVGPAGRTKMRLEIAFGEEYGTAKGNDCDRHGLRDGGRRFSLVFRTEGAGGQVGRTNLGASERQVEPRLGFAIFRRGDFQDDPDETTGRCGLEVP